MNRLALCRTPRGASCLSMVGVAGLVIGCGSPPPPLVTQPTEQVRVMPVVSEDVREKLLEGAVSVLDRLEDYDEESAFSQVFDRLNQWSHAPPPRPPGRWILCLQACPNASAPARRRCRSGVPCLTRRRT